MRKTRKRTIFTVLLSLAMLEAFAVFAFAWFQGSKLKDGFSITTGRLNADISAYCYDDDSNSWLQCLNDMDDTTTTNLQLNGINEQQNIIYVIEKGADSVDLDYSLSFLLETSDAKTIISGSIDLNDEYKYIGGYWYKFADITSSIEMQAGTTDADKISAYMTDTPVATQNPDISVNPLSEIGTRTSFGSLESSTNKNYYILSYGLYDSSTISEYSSVTVRLVSSLNFAQLGALESDESTTVVRYATTLAELNDILEDYTPGTTLAITKDIDYTGDLVITRPLNIITMGGILTVKGNLEISFQYVDNYKISTALGGQIIVKRNNGTGGYFEINTPNSKVTIEGKGKNSNSADIYVQEMITVNASYSEGIIFSGSNIYTLTSSGDIPVGTQSYKTIYFSNNTRITVSSQTYIDCLMPIMGSTTDGATKIVRIYNYGIINQINLYRMIADNDATCEQIYIECSGEITTAILLPYFSVPYIRTLPGTYTGNTYIYQRLTSNTLSVNCGYSQENPTPFTDSDIVKEHIDEYVVSNNVDATSITVYYRNKEDDITPSSLTSLINEFYDNEVHVVGSTDIYADYLTRLKSLTVICLNNKLMDTNDLTFIRSLTNIEEIDLSLADYTGNSIPTQAFKNLTLLESFAFPNTTQIIASQVFMGCSNLIELYLPSSVTNLNRYTFDSSGVKYVHLQTVGSRITCDSWDTLSSNRVILVPEIMLSKYRSLASPQRYIVESIRSNDSAYFYRFNVLGEYEITKYIGNITTVDGAGNKLVGTVKTGTSSSISASSIATYAFYGVDLLDTSLILQESIEKIESYAFTSAKLGSISFSTCSLESYSFQSAYIVAIENGDNIEAIGTNCFQYATLPKRVYMNGITKIPDQAFHTTANMAGLYASNVTEIGSYAVYVCPMLEYLYLPKLNVFTGGIQIWDNPRLDRAYLGPAYKYSGYYGKKITNIFFCGNPNISIARINSNSAGSYCTRTFTTAITNTYFGWNSSNNIITGTIDPEDLIQLDPYKVNDSYEYYKANYYGYIKNGGIVIAGYTGASFSNDDLVVPSSFTIEGVTYPVVELGQYSFRTTSGNLNSLTLGNSIETIGDYCFNRSMSLGTVTIPGVSSIGSYAFSSSNIKQMIGTDNITYVDSYCFYNATLPDVVSFNGLTELPYGCFMNAKNMKGFIAENVVTLNSNSLNSCGSLEYVYCPKVVRMLGDRQIWGNSNLKFCYLGPVYYTTGACGNILNVVICGDGDYTLQRNVSYDWTNYGVRRFICTEAYAAYRGWTRSTYVVMTGTTNPETLIKLDPYKIDTTKYYDVANYLGEIKNGEAIIYGYVGNTTYGSQDIAVPASFEINGVTYPTVELGSCAYRTITSTINSITIPSTIKTIGSYCFDFYNGKSINTLIAPGVETIGKYAFYNVSFANVTMSNVTSVGDYAFYNAAIPNFNMPNLTTVGNYSFYNMIGLPDEVSFPLITEVKDNTFSNISNVKKFEFANLTTAAQNSFKDLPLLEYFYAPKLTTCSNSTVKYILNKCPKLQILYLGIINNMTDDVACSCGQLRYVFLCGDLPTAFVPPTRLNSSFNYNSSTYTLFVKKSVINQYTSTFVYDRPNCIYGTTYDPIDIEFYGEYKTGTYNLGLYLLELDKVNNTASIVRNNCGEIVGSFTVPDQFEIEDSLGVTTIYTTTNIGSYAYYANTFTNATINIPSTITNICSRAFSKTAGNGTVAKTVNSINIYGNSNIESYAFSDLSNINTVSIYGDVTFNSNCFYTLSNVNIKLYSFTQIVARSCDAFGTYNNNKLYLNSSVYNLYISYGTWNRTPTSSMFILSDGLETINNINFYYNYSELTNSVTIVHISGTPLASATILTIPNSVTYQSNVISVTGFDVESLYGATNCTSVILPSTLKTFNLSSSLMPSKLANWMIDSANAYFTTDDGVLYSKDKSILICYPIGKNTTSYTIDSACSYIGSRAFYKATKLNTINYVGSTVYIFDNAFENCANSLTLNFQASTLSKVSMGRNVFSGLANYTISIPNGSIDAFANGYIADTNALNYIVERPAA